MVRVLCRLLPAAAAAFLATAALSASAATAPTLKLRVPKTVHVNKPYRIRVSGQTDARRYLVVFLQTQKQGKCRKTPKGEDKHGAAQVIPRDFVKPVGPGSYKAKSRKLSDSKAHGHDYACAYLMDRTHDRTHDNVLTVVLRRQRRFKSKK